MVSAGEFRKGLTVEIDDQVWTIVDFQHVKPGKGAAFVRTKIKNVISGSVLEKTFNPAEKFPKAHRLFVLSVLGLKNFQLCQKHKLKER